MKPILILAFCLLFMQPASAQQAQHAQAEPDGAEVKNLAVLAGGTIKRAFRTEADYELGYYYNYSESNEIAVFVVCDTNEKMIVPIEKLRQTTDKCESLPRPPSDPIKLSLVRRYEFDLKDGSYHIYTESNDQMPIDFVPCDKIPLQVIAAANLDQNLSAMVAHNPFAGFAVVGDEGNAKRVIGDIGLKNIGSLFTNPQQKSNLSDCTKASRFWTAPALVNASYQVLGVTTKIPGEMR